MGWRRTVDAQIIHSVPLHELLMSVGGFVVSTVIAELLGHQPLTSQTRSVRVSLASGAFKSVSGEIFGHILLFSKVQLVECCDLSVVLHSFGVCSTSSSPVITEVLNINCLLLKFNRFMCN